MNLTLFPHSHWIRMQSKRNKYSQGLRKKKKKKPCQYMIKWIHEKWSGLCVSHRWPHIQNMLACCIEKNERNTIRHLYRKSCRVLCTQNYYTSWNNLFWQKTKISGVTYLQIMGNVYSGFIKPRLKGWVPLWVLLLKRRIEILRYKILFLFYEKRWKESTMFHTKKQASPGATGGPFYLEKMSPTVPQGWNPKQTSTQYRKAA